VSNASAGSVSPVAARQRALSDLASSIERASAARSGLRASQAWSELRRASSRSRVQASACARASRRNASNAACVRSARARSAAEESSPARDSISATRASSAAPEAGLRARERFRERRLAEADPLEGRGDLVRRARGLEEEAALGLRQADPLPVDRLDALLVEAVVPRHVHRVRALGALGGDHEALDPQRAARDDGARVALEPLEVGGEPVDLPLQEPAEDLPRVRLRRAAARARREQRVDDAFDLLARRIVARPEVAQRPEEALERLRVAAPLGREALVGRRALGRVERRRAEVAPGRRRARLGLDEAREALEARAQVARALQEIGPDEPAVRGAELVAAQLDPQRAVHVDRRAVRQALDLRAGSLARADRPGPAVVVALHEEEPALERLLRRRSPARTVAGGAQRQASEQPALHGSRSPRLSTQRISMPDGLPLGRTSSLIGPRIATTLCVPPTTA
jgi:hypothetical protein